MQNHIFHNKDFIIIVINIAVPIKEPGMQVQNKSNNLLNMNNHKDVDQGK